MRFFYFLFFLILVSCAENFLAISSDSAISGYVANEKNEPFVGVIVVLNSKDTVKTDDNGFFIFSGLESGLNVVSIYAEGYIDTVLQNVSVDGKSETALSLIELKKNNVSDLLRYVKASYNIYDEDFAKYDSLEFYFDGKKYDVASSVAVIPMAEVKSHTIHIKVYDFIDTTFVDNVTADFGSIYEKDIVLKGEKYDKNVLSLSLKLSENVIKSGEQAKLLLTKSSVNDITKLLFDFDGDGFYETKLNFWQIEKLYTYSESGDYTIHVKAVDKKGYADTSSINISVN